MNGAGAVPGDGGWNVEPPGLDGAFNAGGFRELHEKDLCDGKRAQTIRIRWNAGADGCRGVVALCAALQSVLCA